ncbi:MAG: DUF4112 domain-containing protein [Acidobacteriaceae bacterium]
MRPNPEPQVIPPGRATPVGSVLDETTLQWLASLLDDVFQIPGTGIRFGLDPLLGLVPGIGDLLTGAASFLIIFSAWQRQIPRVTVARMVANVAIDTLVGSVPLFGDVFDVAWKSNRKNITLLERANRNSIRRQDWRDWLFFVGLFVVMVILVALPIAVLWVIVGLVRS